MNELLKQIAVQAGAYLRHGYKEAPNGDSIWSPDVRIDHSDMDLKMFAELIVQECLQAVQNESMNSGDEWEAGLRIARCAIEERFGV